MYPQPRNQGPYPTHQYFAAQPSSMMQQNPPQRAMRPGGPIMDPNNSPPMQQQQQMQVGMPVVMGHPKAYPPPQNPRQLGRMQQQHPNGDPYFVNQHVIQHEGQQAPIVVNVPREVVAAREIQRKQQCLEEKRAYLLGNVASNATKFDTDPVFGPYPGYSEWATSWRVRVTKAALLDKKKGDDDLIGLCDSSAQSLVVLLAHYKTLIVYVGYSFWRKLLEMVSFDVYGNGRIPEGSYKYRLPTLLKDPKVGVKASHEYYKCGMSGILSRGKDCYLPRVYLDIEPRSRPCLGENTFADPLNTKQFGFTMNQSTYEFGDFFRSLVDNQQLDVVVVLVKEFNVELNARWGGTVVRETDTDTVSTTPLLLALSKGCVSTVEDFLARGARVNFAELKTKRTALHAAAAFGRFDLMELVVIQPHGEQLVSSQDSHGETPLFGAAKQKRDSQPVQFLLGLGADATHVSNCGRTPLHYAATAGNKENVELLLRGGADPCAKTTGDSDNLNIKGDTPLGLAATSGSLDVLRVLLGCDGVDVNVRNKNGWTPLHLAGQRGFAECVKLLLDHGADPTIKSKSGWTASSVSKKGNDEIKALLLQAAEAHQRKSEEAHK